MLCNSDAIKAGIAIEGAKLILQAKTKFQAPIDYNAYYISEILCNPQAIKSGKALEIAKCMVLHPEDDGKLLAEKFINEAEKAKQRFSENNKETKKEPDIPNWDHLIEEVKNGDDDIKPMLLVRKIPNTNSSNQQLNY